MSEAPTRPAEGDKNPGPSLIAMFTVFCTTAVAFMGARVWSRLRLQSFGVEYELLPVLPETPQMTLTNHV